MANESVIADLTCSLCLGMFRSPKMMTNCPHTFCLECLKQVPIGSTFPHAIACPECRCLSYVGRDGIEGFSTNIVVQNVVEKMREAQRLSKALCEDENVDADVCVHLMLEQQRQTCRHCKKQFCNACKYRHMEKLKDKIVEISKNYDVTLVVSIKEAIGKVSLQLQQDVSVIDTKLHVVSDALLRAIQASLSTKTAATSERLKQFAEAEVQRLYQLMDDIACSSKVGQAALSERQQHLTSVSIFKQDLDEVSQLFLDLSEQENILHTIKQISSLLDSSLLTFTPVSDFSEIVSNLAKTVQLGCLKVNQTAVDAGYALTQESSETLRAISESMMTFTSFNHVEVQTEPYLLSESSPMPLQWPELTPGSSIESSASQSALLAPETPTPSSVGTISNHHPAFNHVSQVNVTRPVSRLIALPSKGFFAVSHGRNRISLIRPSGELVDTLAVLNPSDVQRIEINDLASDGQLIFFTANVTDADGKKSRRIYRFCMEEFQPALPTCFAVGREPDEDRFHGIAISEEFSWVVTTEGDSVVALASTNLPRNELGSPVARWSVGPSPFLHAVDDYSRGLKVICSVDDGCVRTYVCPNDPNRKVEEIPWQFEGRPLRINKPSFLCHWDEKALVAKSGFLREYGNVNESPEYIGTFPASICSGFPTKVKAVAALQLLDNQQMLQDYVAILFLSDDIALAQLTS